MIPVDQEILQGIDPDCQPLPGQRPGDCLRACVASLLEWQLHEVPHFIEQYGADWFDGIRSFLVPATLAEFTMACTKVVWPPLVDVTDPDDLHPLQRYVIASGPSPRGPWLHAVLADTMTGEVVHDPHPTRAGLAGPVVDLLVLVPA